MDLIQSQEIFLKMKIVHGLLNLLLTSTIFNVRIIISNKHNDVLFKTSNNMIIKTFLMLKY